MARRARPKRRNEPDEIIRTFQLRLRGEFPALDDMAGRYQQAKRTVYGRSKLTGGAFADLKNETVVRFGLPARMFNAIQKNLNGMAESVREKAKFDIAQTEDRLEQLAKRRAELEIRLAGNDLSQTERRKRLREYHHKRISRDHKPGTIAGARGGAVPQLVLRLTAAVHRAALPGGKPLRHACRLTGGLARRARQPVLRGRLQR